MRRKVAWASVVLSLVAFALRVVRVGDASYWGDELVSVVTGQLPTVEVIQWVAENDPHPPLYYLLIHAWMGVVGNGEFATRVLSVLIGTLAVPLLGALAQRLLGGGVAIAAMALIAINPLHVAQAREDRMYPLVVALTIGSTLVLVRGMNGERRTAKGEGGAGGQGPGVGGRGSGVGGQSRRSETPVVVAAGSPFSGEASQSRRSETPVAAAAGSRFGGDPDLLGSHDALSQSHSPDGERQQGAVLVPPSAFRLPPSAWWFAYVALTALSLYSHYYAGLVAIAQGLFVLAHWRTDAPFVRRYLTAALVAAGLFLPWLVPGLTVVGDYQGYTWSPAEYGWWSLPVALRACLDTFATGPWSLPEPWRPVAELYLVAGLACGVIAGWRRDRRLVLLLGLYLLVPIITIYLASFSRPIFTPKYLIAASPAYYLLLAAGAVFLTRSVRGRAVPALATAMLLPGLAIFGTGVSNLLSDPKLANADWRAAAAFVTARERPNDGLIYGHDGIKWLFGYYHRTPLAEYLPPFGVAGREREIDAALTAFARDHERIWFVPWWQSETDTYVEHWLNIRAYKVLNRWLGPIRVTLYATANGEPALQPVDYPFGDSFQLTGWSADREVVEPGDVLRLGLQWQAMDDFDEDAKVLVKLIDDRGRVQAVSDRLPRDEPTNDLRRGARLIDRVGVLIPPGTPAGIYRIDVDLYWAETGERLMPAGPNAPGQRVVLGQVRVAETERRFAVEAVEAEQRSDWLVGGGAVRLAGYTLEKGPKRPGDIVNLTLFWRIERDGAVGTFKVAADPVVSAPVNANGGRLRAGAIVREDAALRILPSAARRQYALVLDDFRDPVPFIGRPRYPLGIIDVIGPADLPAPARPERAIEAEFAGGIVLEGVTVKRRPDGLAVQLVWKTNRDVPESFAVFVHLVDREGRIVAQSDQIPANGAAPTSGWIPERRMGDDHDLKTAAVPAGGQLRIGLYAPATLSRVTTGSGDAVVITVDP